MTIWLFAIPSSFGALSVLILQTGTPTEDGMALAQYGVLGIVASASAAGMTWLARRFISHLETSAIAQSAALREAADALNRNTETTTRLANSVAGNSEATMGLAVTVNTLQKAVEILLREYDRHMPGGRR